MKKTNNNNTTELVFILDRSGSMAGLEADTIGGFNSLINKQKQIEGKCYVSTVLFDNECKVITTEFRSKKLGLLPKENIGFVAVLHLLTL